MVQILSQQMVMLGLGRVVEVMLVGTRRSGAVRGILHPDTEDAAISLATGRGGCGRLRPYMGLAGQRSLEA